MWEKGGKFLIILIVNWYDDTVTCVGLSTQNYVQTHNQPATHASWEDDDDDVHELRRLLGRTWKV